MFIKKDLRKVQQILADSADDRREIKLFRRGPEFVNGPGRLFDPKNASAFANLEYLSLYGNSLTTVEGIGVLKDSPLQRLNLGDNLLADLPEDFRQLKQLKELWIEDNEFKEFPGAVIGLDKLERLCASGNALRVVPPEVRTLKRLQVLSLNNNAIEMLPDQLGLLVDLTHLDVSGNELVELPAALAQLQRLSFLVASSNLLETLPHALGDMTGLVRLRVNKNRLTRLSPWVVSLLTDGSLRFLNAANNALRSVPPELLGFLPAAAKADAASRGDAIAPTSFPHPVQVNLLGNPDIQVGIATVPPSKRSRASQPDGDAVGCMK